MAVYQILEDIMKEKSLSIADISKICNIPDSTVRGIVKRKQETIALEVAFKLSDGLGVSLERLNGIPEKRESSAQTDGGLAQIDAIFLKLSPDNRSKLTELALLYLNAQNNGEGNQ